MAELCFGCFTENENKGPCPICGYEPSLDAGKFPNSLPHGSILKERYIVGRVLGQGGFGITYAALDFATKKLVAIKEYLPEVLAGRDSTGSVRTHSAQRSEDFDQGKLGFLDEANTLVDFKENSHIVNIHDFFEENGTAYFVMEFVRGMSLKKYVKSMGGRLGEEEANRILLPIMNALCEVHAKGIIHRDIAPDNIIVTAQGSAKLIDFGAARYSTGEKSQSLDVILKHGYAPKEQYTRRGKQGPFTDVYAMAATYYFAVTGRVPPDAIDRTEEESLIAPSTLGIELARDTEAALMKALEVQHADRYQSMGEFMQALKGQTEPEKAPENKPEIKGTKPEKENKPEKASEGEKLTPPGETGIFAEKRKLLLIGTAAALVLFLLSIFTAYDALECIERAYLRDGVRSLFYIANILFALSLPLVLIGFIRKSRRFVLPFPVMLLVCGLLIALQGTRSVYAFNSSGIFWAAWLAAFLSAIFMLLMLCSKKPIKLFIAAALPQLVHMAFAFAALRRYRIYSGASFDPYSNLMYDWIYGVRIRFTLLLLARLAIIAIALALCALPKASGAKKKPQISLPKTPIAKKAAPEGKPGKAETLIQKHSGLICKISAVAALVLFVISIGGVSFAFQGAAEAAGRNNLSVPFYIFTALAWIGYLLIGAGLWLGRRAMIVPTAMLLALSGLFSFTFGSLYFVILSKLCSLVYAVFLLLALRAERPLLPAAAAVLSQLAHVIVIGSWRGEYSWIYTFSSNVPTMKAIQSYVYSSDQSMGRFLLIRLFLCIIALAICALPPVTEGARSLYLKPLCQKIKKLKK